MEQKKIVLFAFQGEVMCFVHVLLNAREYHDKGYDVKVVLEGQSTRLVSVLNQDGAPFHELYKTIKDLGLIDCVCQACAAKTGVLECVVAEGLRVDDSLSGHPSMEWYTSQGYTIITF